MSESIELEKAALELLDGNILCIRYKDGFEIDLEDAKEIDQTQFDMSGGKKIRLLVDIYKVSNSVTKEAKNYFNNKGKMLRVTLAVAILQVDKQRNLKTSLLAEILRPLYPTKSFESKDRAMEWLRSI